jgi:hypothetical protein
MFEPYIVKPLNPKAEEITGNGIVIGHRQEIEIVDGKQVLVEKAIVLWDKVRTPSHSFERVDKLVWLDLVRNSEEYEDDEEESDDDDPEEESEELEGEEEEEELELDDDSSDDEWEDIKAADEFSLDEEDEDADNDLVLDGSKVITNNEAHLLSNT